MRGRFASLDRERRKGSALNLAAVFSRTMVSWQLAFVHLGKTLHFLMRALLLTVALVGCMVAWLCCWLDRFRSSRDAGAWIIPVRLERVPLVELDRPERFAERGQAQPRTIDRLIQAKGVRV
jgi:hypothetical protein